MAILKCTECGTRFEDSLECCPNCGCPKSNEDEKQDAEKRPMSAKRKAAIISLIVVCIVAVCAAVFFFVQPTSRKGVDKVAVTDSVKGEEDKGVEITQSLIDATKRYVKCYPFENGFAIVRNSEEKEGVIDIHGKEVVPCIYSRVDLFKDGFHVESDGMKGYLNTKGETMIPCEYKLLGDLSDDRISFMRDRLWGYMDQNGREVIECQWDGADDFSEGLAVVSKNGKTHIINKSGETIGSLGNSGIVIQKFHDGLALVSQYNETFGSDEIGGERARYGFINEKGEFAVPLKYDQARDFAEDMAIVARHEEKDVVAQNEDGETLINGSDLKWGVINKHGQQIVPTQYQQINDYSDGMAVAINNRFFGVLDKKGNVVVTFKYDRIEDFSEGYATVLKDGKCSIVNKQGKVILPFDYEEICPFGEGLALAKKNGKYGAIGKDGKVIIPFRYDDELPYKFCEGLAVVHFNGKWGFVNKKGEDTFGNR